VEAQRYVATVVYEDGDEEELFLDQAQAALKPSHWEPYHLMDVDVHRGAEQATDTAAQGDDAQGTKKHNYTWPPPSLSRNLVVEVPRQRQLTEGAERAALWKETLRFEKEARREERELKRAEREAERQRKKAAAAAKKTKASGGSSGKTKENGLGAKGGKGGKGGKAKVASAMKKANGNAAAQHHTSDESRALDAPLEEAVVIVPGDDEGHNASVTARKKKAGTEKGSTAKQKRKQPVDVEASADDNPWAFFRASKPGKPYTINVSFPPKSAWNALLNGLADQFRTGCCLTRLNLLLARRRTPKQSFCLPRARMCCLRFVAVACLLLTEYRQRATPLLRRLSPSLSLSAI
jgi:hypothetical protein